MPGLGVMICRGNVLAIKFQNELNEYVKLVPQKLIQTKKEAHLFMDVVDKNRMGKKPIKQIEQPISNIIPNNLNRTLVNLRPKT